VPLDFAAGAARTHPRHARPVVQLGVLATAVLVGALLGLALLAADSRSWRGADTVTATVTGRSDQGVLAQAAGRQVVLHTARIPVPGTRLTVEVSPDGRARPVSYRQTPGRALRSGVLLAVGLVALVQVYRWFVTG